MESKALLASFHIPIAKTVLTRSANEAMLVAQELGFPVAMKIDSPDIAPTNPTPDGVSLDLGTAQAVRRLPELPRGGGREMPPRRADHGCGAGTDGPPPRTGES